MNKTYTIGRNKGKTRLWLEGAILQAAGFKPGMRYHVDQTNAGLGGLVLTLHPEGARKVSGKGDKPIIDIMSQKELAHFEPGDKVTVDAFRRAVTVIRIPA